jgi:hypothetical protein
MFHTKSNHPTHEPFKHKTMKHGNAEFLQPYSVAAADGMHKIGTALISAVLSLGERLSQTLPVPRKSYY